MVETVEQGGEVEVPVKVELTMEQIANGTVQPVATPVETPITATPEGTPTLEVDPLINQEKVQEKINKITAAKYKEQRRADELQSKLDALEEANKPVLPTEAPDLESYDFDEDRHQEATIQYQVQKALEAQKQEVVQQQLIQAKEQTANDFTIKETEYINTHPEYAEEISNLPIFKQDTLSAIYELGPQVSHYLAKHLDVAGEIANASPTMAAVKLGQISMGLSADKQTVKTSTAPAPVTTLGGGGSVNKSLEDLSMDEIMNLP